MDIIKKGDVVDIHYCDGGKRKNLTVICTPGGPGELWHFKDKDGRLIALNPSASNFEEIVNEGGNGT